MSLEKLDIQLLNNINMIAQQRELGQKIVDNIQGIENNLVDKTLTQSGKADDADITGKNLMNQKKIKKQLCHT